MGRYIQICTFNVLNIYRSIQFQDEVLNDSDYVVP